MHLLKQIKQKCETVLSLLQRTKIGKKNRNGNEKLITIDEKTWEGDGTEKNKMLIRFLDCFVYMIGGKEDQFQ